MSTSLLNKKSCEKMKEIFTLYIQDEDNLKDGDKLKSYGQVIRDLKGLVSAHIIRKMLKELNPELARAMKTKKKHHYMKI